MWGNFSILDALLTIFLTELFTLITWQISAVFLDAGKVDIRFSSTIRLGVQEHLSTFVLNNSLFHKCNLWIYVIVSASTIHYVLVAAQSELYRTSTLLPQKETSSTTESFR